MKINKKYHYKKNNLNQNHYNNYYNGFKNGFDYKKEHYMEELLNYNKLFGHKLKQFQREAFKILKNTNKNLIVTAPTGSGKTHVIYMACVLAMKENKRVVILEPTIALAREIRKKLFQISPRVGLITGEIQLDTDAPVVVAIAESVRNILGGYKEEKKDKFLRRVKYIVVDEFHFIGEYERGPIYEEVIINIPQDIVFVGMSATIGNPEELQKWITKIKGETELIKEEEKDKELKFYYGGELDCSHHGYKEIIEEGEISDEIGRIYCSPSPVGEVIVSIIKDKENTPLLVVGFSKKMLMETAKYVAYKLLSMKSPLHDREPEDLTMQEVIEAGVGIHWRGLPFKVRKVVEDKMRKEEFPVVIATETITTGIDVKFKGCVIIGGRKYDSETKGFRDLTKNELKQITGRVARNGEEGRIFFVGMHKIDAKEYYKLITSKETSPIKSKLNGIEAGMFLNIYKRAHKDIKKIGEIVRKSLAYYKNIEKEKKAREDLKNRDELLKKVLKDTPGTAEWVEEQINMYKRFEFIKENGDLTWRGELTRVIPCTEDAFNILYYVNNREVLGGLFKKDITELTIEELKSFRLRIKEMLRGLNIVAERKNKEIEKEYKIRIEELFNILEERLKEIEKEMELRNKNGEG